MRGGFHNSYWSSCSFSFMFFFTFFMFFFTFFMFLFTFFCFMEFFLFGDLFFVEISFEEVGCSMGSKPCFSPVGSKVTSGHFLSVPVCHEKRVFHTFHFLYPFHFLLLIFFWGCSFSFNNHFI